MQPGTHQTNLSGSGSSDHRNDNSGGYLTIREAARLLAECIADPTVAPIRRRSPDEFAAIFKTPKRWKAKRA